MTTIEELLAAVINSGSRGVVAVTGGGAGVLGELLRRGGGSKVLLEGVVPYAEAALADFNSGAHDRACCEETARRMATSAWRRARELHLAGKPRRPSAPPPPTDAPPPPPASPKPEPHLFGVGATAMLAKVGERATREHRLHVATHSAARTTCRSVVLPRLPRTEQERLAELLVLEAVAEAALPSSPVPRLIDPQLLVFDQAVRRGVPADWGRLVTGAGGFVRVPPHPAAQDNPQPPLQDVSRPAPALLCGSFNPPHMGHVGMARTAARLLGCAVDFELSITNADKPPLDWISVTDRTSQVAAAGHALVLTDAPLFVDKAAMLPGRTFVVGMDTWERISNPIYYGGPAGFAASLDQLSSAGASFLVFGRLESDGFHAPVPAGEDAHEFLRTRVRAVPGSEFRLDMSSSRLRTAGADLHPAGWSDRGV